MEYSDETLRAWKSGEIHELAYFLGDVEGQGTFFKWIDAEVGYPYPTFVSGDEKLFDAHQRLLIEHSQSNS